MIMRCDEVMEIGRRYVKAATDALGEVHRGVPAVVVRKATRDEWIAQVLEYQVPDAAQRIANDALFPPDGGYYDLAFD